MGSSSSSYAPKSIYLDVDGKVQKVGPILTKMFLPMFSIPHPDILPFQRLLLY